MKCEKRAIWKYRAWQIHNEQILSGVEEEFFACGLKDALTIARKRARNHLGSQYDIYIDSVILSTENFPTAINF